MFAKISFAIHLYFCKRKRNRKTVNNMKNTNPIFTLKNFRSFGEDGADFELAPITVLTGCNSAGKSSLVKAVLLLNKLPKGTDYESPALKLYASDLCLGSFDNVLYKHANERTFELSYKVWSYYVQEMITIKMKFGTHKNDALNDGFRWNTVIENDKGEVIFDQSEFMRDWEKDNEWAKCISENYIAFSKVCEYYQILRDEFRYEFILQEAKKDNSIDLEKATEDYNRIEQAIEKARIEMRSNNIDPEKYKTKQLDDWNSWISHRKSSLGEWLSVAKTEEEIKQDMDVHFHEDEVIRHFLSLVRDEVFSPWFVCNSLYINSESARIRRVYSVEAEDKTSRSLRDLNINKSNLESLSIASQHNPGAFLNKWIKRFNLGVKIETIGDKEGGIKVYLNNGKEKRLLADEGYGISQLVFLLLAIDLCIPSFQPNECENPWENGKVNYRELKPKIQPLLICVEEPEIHLHPKYQSLLAEMFVEAYQKYNFHFIIETHSEYLIRKLQVMVADKEIALSPNDVSLNYVEKDENGASHNRQIKIQEDGRLSEPFGPGFFDEATGLSMHLLKMKMEAK